MGRLPSGYTEVEYIESTGTQYIDTGYAINALSDIKMDFELTGYPTTSAGNWAILGGNNNSGTEMMLAWGNYNTHYINGQRVVYGLSNNLRYDMDLDITVGSQSLTLNDIVVFTGTSSRTPTGQKLYLFGGIGTFQGSSIDTYDKMKLYSAELYDTSGNLVRNYVPCKNSSDVAGMYDLVTSTFYGNSGTGTFIAGPVVHSNTIKVYNGSEWVDGTPYVYTENGWVEADTVYVYTENGWVEKD